MPSFEGNLLAQRHRITSLETRDSRLSDGENPVSLSDLGLISVPGRDTPDGRTDRIPIANTRSQQYLPVQLSRVKMSSKSVDTLLRCTAECHFTLYFLIVKIPWLMIQNPQKTPDRHQNLVSFFPGPLSSLTKFSQHPFVTA